jgi:hypothetical protein
LLPEIITNMPSSENMRQREQLAAAQHVAAAA